MCHESPSKTPVGLTLLKSTSKFLHLVKSLTNCSFLYAHLITLVRYAVNTENIFKRSI